MTLPTNIEIGCDQAVVGANHTAHADIQAMDTQA